MKKLIEQNVSGVIEMKILLLKNLPDDGFPLNLGALTLILGEKRFTLDSVQTNFKNHQIARTPLTFATNLEVDLETFPEKEVYNYELTEADLKNKELKSEFFCEDGDTGIENAFAFDEAEIILTIYVDGREYNIKNVKLEK